jgi:chromosome segregation ATPase
LCIGLQLHQRLGEKMEVDARLGMQLAIMLATIAGGYSVVKNQLSRVIEDLEAHIKSSDNHKNSFDARLDEAESQRAVFSSRLDVLADINSVAALERRNREVADIQARIKVMENQIQSFERMHNGTHPPIGNT